MRKHAVFSPGYFLGRLLIQTTLLNLEEILLLKAGLRIEFFLHGILENVDGLITVPNDV